jgi:hypothetical protein
MMDDDRPEPKFKVGQIVVMNSLKKQLPFRIQSVTWYYGWNYAWNRKNYASESMIRKLTPDEYGDAEKA